MAEKIYDLMGLADFFVDYDSDDDEEIAALEKRSIYWGDRMEEIMGAAGADADALPSKRWSRWRQEAGW